MGLLKGLEYGAYGFMADRLMFPMSGGMGMGAGFLAGLFTPDAKDMGQAAARSPFADLLDSFLGRPRSPAASNDAAPEAAPAQPKPGFGGLGTVVKAAVAFLGASLFLGNGFGMPFAGFLPGIMPWMNGFSPLAMGPDLIAPYGWGGFNI